MRVAVVVALVRLAACLLAMAACGRPARPTTASTPTLARPEVHEDERLPTVAVERPVAAMFGRPVVVRVGAAALLAAELHYQRVFLPHRFPYAADLAHAKAHKQTLEKVMVATQDSYQALVPLGHPYGTIARLRYGETMYLFAEKMANAPVPGVITQLHVRGPGAGVIEAYAEGLDRHLAPYRAAAEDALREVVASEATRGPNRWTAEARADLARWFP